MLLKIIFILCSFFASVQANARLIAIDNFDYFVLSLQWNHAEKRFTCHGQWPNNYDGSYPSFCRRLQYDDKILDPILDRLKRDWPSNIHGHDTGFWHHELIKHYSCCESYFEGPVDYLNKTMNMYEAIKDDIYPQVDRMSGREVCDYIEDHVGTTPVIECQQMYGLCRMKETWMCFNKNLERIDCPGNKAVFSCEDYTVIY